MKPRLIWLLVLFQGMSGWGSACAQLWEPLGEGLDNGIYELYPTEVGEDLIVLGNFDSAGSISCAGVARWDGSIFHPMGSGIRNQAGYSLAIYYNPVSAVEYDGSIIIAGGFPFIDHDTSAGWLAEYNGMNWQSKGTKISSYARVDRINGELFAYVEFHHAPNTWPIYKWVGEDWVEFGPLIAENYQANISGAFHRGRYFFAGGFHNQENGIHNIAEWTGIGWDAVGPGVLGNAIIRDLVSYKGMLYLSGDISQQSGNPATNIIAWDGNQYFNPFPKVVYTSQVLKVRNYNDTLYIVGQHYIETPSGYEGPYGLAMFDGMNFCSIGGQYFYANAVAKYKRELICGTSLTSQGIISQGDTIKYLARYIGGPENYHCIKQPVSAPPPATPALSFSLFPNPGDGLVQVRWEASKPGPVQIEVDDIYGRKISSKSLHQQEGSSTVELDLGQLPAGTYLVRMLSGDGQVTVKYVRL